MIGLKFFTEKAFRDKEDEGVVDPLRDVGVLKYLIAEGFSALTHYVPVLLVEKRVQSIWFR